MTLSNGKPLDQFPAQRSCIAYGCTALLSRYNPNATCATHGGWTEDKEPRRRARTGVHTS